jgi:hypothetical protein
MRCALVLALVFTGGCSSDLPVASFIEKLRVLAVQAEPPEVAPGQSTALAVLAVEPPVPQQVGPPPSGVSYLWLACTVPAGLAEQAPCGLSAAAPLPGAAAGSATMPPFCKDAPDASLCIVSTSASGSYTPPASVLDGDRTTQVLVSVTVADSAEGAVGCLLDAANNNNQPTDPDHCVLALKRLVVTDPTRPLSDGALPTFNHNPTLADFHFAVPDGGPMASLTDGTAEFAPSPESGAGEAELHAIRADDAAEIEPIFDDQGNVTGSRYESLTVAWFTTAGKIDGGRSAYSPPDCVTQQQCPAEAPELDTMTQWKAPTSAGLPTRSTDGRVRFWAVVRDDRGGVSWLEGSAHTP